MEPFGTQWQSLINSLCLCVFVCVCVKRIALDVSNDPFTNLPTVAPLLSQRPPPSALLKRLVKAEDTSLYHLARWVAAPTTSYHLSYHQVAVLRKG